MVHNCHSSNAAFTTLLKESIRHPDAGKHDVKAFVNRPIPRLLRYELLLKEILGSTPSYHDDRDAIPEVIELISALARETQPGVESAKQKVEMWRYNANLILKTGEAFVSSRSLYVCASKADLGGQDMELLDENCSLLHAGKVLGRPDNTIQELDSGWTGLNSGWTELNSVYQYLQPSVPLNVEEVFQETNGRNLGDVLRDAVQKVSIGDVS